MNTSNEKRCIGTDKKRESMTIYEKPRIESEEHFETLVLYCVRVEPPSCQQPGPFTFSN